MSEKQENQKNPLNKEDLKFLKSKTNINQNTILRYYEKFTEKFPGGQINRLQFETLIKKMIIVNLEQMEEKACDAGEIEKKKAEMCDRMWTICDHDEDGTIDFKEYLVLFWARINGDEKEKLSLIFDLFDTNRSGYLDFHEVHSIVKILFKLKYSENETNGDSRENSSFKGDSELKSYSPNLFFSSNLPLSYYISMNIMKKFDSNMDAKLSCDEFINGCLAYDAIRNFLTPLNFF